MGLLRKVLKAWALGIVSWDPPHVVRTEFLLVWAVIMVAAAIGVPKLLLLGLPWWLLALGGVAFVIGAGLMNYAFLKAFQFGSDRDDPPAP